MTDSAKEQDRTTHPMELDGKGWLIQLLVTVVLVTVAMFYFGVIP